MTLTWTYRAMGSEWALAATCWKLVQVLMSRVLVTSLGRDLTRMIESRSAGSRYQDTE